MNPGNQLRLPFRRPARPPARGLVRLGTSTVDVEFIRNVRARHYIVRVAEAGLVRVTIPRWGSRAGAEEFLHRQADWVSRERYRASLGSAAHGPWRDGSPILLRGTEVPLSIVTLGGRRVATFADQRVDIPDDTRESLTTRVERHLRLLARRELEARLGEFASVRGCAVPAISVRAQRTRWGSCSPTGRVSLNWRLVQLPAMVRDYVLLHELTHLEHPNHSRRFWRQLERACPWFREARAWLRSNGPRLTR